MGEWPILTGGGPLSQAFVSLANTRHQNVTASGSTNTKGSYSELVASSPVPADQVTLTFAGSSNATYLVDIAIGGAGSEVVIVPDVYLPRATQAIMGMVTLPIRIPAGTRIAARCQSTVASAICIVGALLHPADGVGWGLPGGGLVTAYGAVTASSKGTDVDPGGTAATKGSWVQLTASTAQRHRHLMLAFGPAADLARTASQRALVDIAVGAGGSEVVIVPDLMLTLDAGTDQPIPMFACLPVSIPAGVRLAARCSSTVNTAGDRVLDMVAYGVA